MFDPEKCIEINAQMEELLLNAVKPNIEKVKELLSMNPETFTDLSNEGLSQSLFLFSQYLIFLQQQVNLANIRFADAKKDYELELALVTASAQGKTLKEKNANALHGSEKLQSLFEELRAAERGYLLVEKIPDQMVELSNSIKKEIAFRTSGFGKAHIG